MTTQCTEVRTSLGVYVLGAIEPSERSRVDTHVGTCSRCRDELAGLAGLPALLGRVSEEQIAQVVEPPAELLEAVVAKAVTQSQTRQRKQRRLRLLVAAAVMLVGLTGGALGGKLLLGGSEEQPDKPFAVVMQTEQQVRAKAELFQKGWGTEVELHLGGVPAGTRCSLIAVSRDGRREIAANWEVAPVRYDEYYGSTAIKREQLTGFEIVTHDGRRLLTLPVA